MNPHPRLTAAVLARPVTPLHDLGDRVTATFTARVGEARQTAAGLSYDIYLAAPHGLLLVRDVPAFRLVATEG